MFDFRKIRSVRIRCLDKKKLYIDYLSCLLCQSRQLHHKILVLNQSLILGVITPFSEEHILPLGKQNFKELGTHALYLNNHRSVLATKAWL